MGRPGWDYEESIGQEICEAIATSKDGLNKLVEQNPHWPSVKIIYKWVLKFPDFGHKYAQARELQQEVRVNYAYERAHNEERDMYVDEKGVSRPNMAAIARDKLLTDTIKWEAARLSRKYKDKSESTQTVVTHESGLKELA